MEYIKSYEILAQLDKKATIDKYVAISYVWSQYDDNDKAKTEILRMVNATQTQLIGEDTMTINKVWWDRKSNITKTGDKDYKAINRMNEIYSHASYTIALIPELDSQEENSEAAAEITDNCGMKTILENIERKHIYYRIAHSQWFSRAWTFQEQIVSDKIYTSIHDRITDITFCVHDIIASRYMTFGGTGYLWSVTEMIQGYLDKHSSNEVIDSIKNELNNRDLAWIKKVIISNQDPRRERNKCDIITRAKEGTLTFLECLKLLQSRAMGRDNEGYEPIKAICKDITCKRELVHLSTIAYNAGRIDYPGLCWMPDRLRYDEEILDNCVGEYGEIGEMGEIIFKLRRGLQIGKTYIIGAAIPKWSTGDYPGNSYYMRIIINQVRHETNQYVAHVIGMEEHTSQPSEECLERDEDGAYCHIGTLRSLTPPSNSYPLKGSKPSGA